MSQMLTSEIDDIDPAHRAELVAHGRLRARRIAALRRTAVEEVVGPCAARLLRSRASTESAAHIGRI